MVTCRQCINHTLWMTLACKIDCNNENKQLVEKFCNFSSVRDGGDIVGGGGDIVGGEVITCIVHDLL